MEASNVLGVMVVHSFSDSCLMQFLNAFFKKRLDIFHINFSSYSKMAIKALEAQMKSRQLSFLCLYELKIKQINKQRKISMSHWSIRKSRFEHVKV